MKKKFMILTVLIGLGALIYVSEVKAQMYVGDLMMSGRVKCYNTFTAGGTTFVYCHSCVDKTGTPGGGTGHCR